MLQISNHRLDYPLRIENRDGTTLPSPDQRGKKVQGNNMSDEKFFTEIGFRLHLEPTLTNKDVYFIQK